MNEIRNISINSNPTADENDEYILCRRSRRGRNITGFSNTADNESMNDFLRINSHVENNEKIFISAQSLAVSSLQTTKKALVNEAEKLDIKFKIPQ